MMPFYYGSEVRSVAVVSLGVAAAIVLTYTALGGLCAAIYNEVLQFFVIVAACCPRPSSA